MAYHTRGYYPYALTKRYPEGDIYADPFDEGWKDPTWVAQYGTSVGRTWIESMSFILDWFVDEGGFGQGAVARARVNLALWLRTHFRIRLTTLPCT